MKLKVRIFEGKSPELYLAVGHFVLSPACLREKGGCLAKETIMKLKRLNIPFELGETSGYRTHEFPVRMKYLDDIGLPEFRELPSYKRMCVCILKNDHSCKYMGFSQNKQERERRRRVMNEYGTYFNE